MKANRNISTVYPYKNGFFFRKLNVSGYCFYTAFGEGKNYWECMFHRVRKYEATDIEELRLLFDKVVVKCNMVLTVKELIISDEAMMLMMAGVMGFKASKNQINFTHPSGATIKITTNE